MSRDHKFRTLPPDTTTADARMYEVCDCGAKRALYPNYEGTARTEPLVIWISGPHEHPRTGGRADAD